MAITSKGYAGTIDYADWAELSDRMGAQYSVYEIGAFAASLGAGTREVVVQAGLASGKGIRDVSDSVVSLFGASVIAGDRWDTIVLRRKWTAPAATTLELISGTSTKAIASGRNVNPGVLDDQPLWLVRFSAGLTAPQELVDLRVWRGDGGMVAKELLVQSYLTRIGTRIMIDGITWVLGFNAAENATQWIPDSPYVSATQPAYFENLVWINPTPTVPEVRVGKGGSYVLTN